MTSSSEHSGYFVIETIHTIKVNNILVAFALIQISNQIRSVTVTNSGFYKTNMAHIFNLSIGSSAGAKKKSLIKSNLNGADLYLLRHYTELAVSD